MSATASLLILLCYPSCLAQLCHAVATGLGSFTDAKIGFCLVLSSLLLNSVGIEVFSRTGEDFLN